MKLSAAPFISMLTGTPGDFYFLIHKPAALELQTRINGEVMQRGTTADLIFGPADLVAWLTRTITLLPGDIIATGTPAGVGAAQGRFLHDGDTIEVEINGLGTLVNPVRNE